jgi:hypothetical protein
MYRFISCSVLIKLIALAGLIWSALCLSRQLELKEDGKKLELIRQHIAQHGEDVMDYAFGGTGESGSEIDMTLAYTATNVAFYGVILLIGCACVALAWKSKMK